MSINVTRFHNVLSADKETYTVEAGLRYDHLIGAVDNALVYCNGRPVPKTAWSAVVPDNSFVIIRDMPTAAATLVGIIFWTAFVAISATVVYTVGKYLYDKLKAKDSVDFETLPGVRGSSNAVRKWGVIPVILGKHYIAPPYAGNAYTEIAGTDGVDQYIHLSFLVGYGPLSVSELRLGENLLASNSGDVRSGTIPITGLYAAYGDVAIEILQGVADQAKAMAYYPNRVTEDQFDMEMRRPAAGPVYLYRTTAKGCTKIECDFELPNGLYRYNDEGKVRDASVEWVSEYRLEGSEGAYTPLTKIGDTTDRQIKQTARYTYYSGTLAANAYEIRTYRTTADATDTRADSVHWMCVRSTLATAVIPEDVCEKIVRISMRAKASSVVSGSLGQFSLIAQALIPEYDGSGSGAAQWALTTLVTKPIQANPAAEALYLLRGAVNATPIPDTDIDWAAFEALYTWCDTAAGSEKRNECNAILDESLTLNDALSKVLSTARASITTRGNIITLVHDDVKTTPVALITPRNSGDFKATKAFNDLVHGYKISFINREAGYQADVCIVLDDGYKYDIKNDGGLYDAWGNTPTTQVLATKLESIDRWGITSVNEAFREGRYLLAKARLRPELYSQIVDIQSICYSRGDLVRFGNDTPLLGVRGGRIKSITLDVSEPYDVLSCVGDDEYTMETGKAYGIRYQRASDAAVLFAPVTTVVGTGHSLVFNPAIETALAPAVDDVFWFGEIVSGTPEDTKECIIVSIEPGADLTATVVLEDYAPAVFTADVGTIPTYDSMVTLPVARGVTLPIGEDKSIEQVAAATAAAAAAARATYALVKLTPTVESLSRSRTGVYTPITITYNATLNAVAYPCRFSVKERDVSGIFAEVYASSTDEDTYVHTPSAGIIGVRVAISVVQDDLSLLELKSIDILVKEDTSNVPIYWGALTTAPASGYLINDYYFDNNTSALGGGILRYWTGSAWVEMTSAHPLYQQALWNALADMGAWATAQDSVIAAASAIFNKLVTADAFIANLFAQQITVPDGGRIRYYNGQGVQKRCVQLAEDRVDWLDTPDTTPASDELLQARIGRLGVGETVLLDGVFTTSVVPYWATESVINAASASFPNYIQLDDGSIHTIYRRNSDNYLCERVYSGSTWGAESVINAASSLYPNCIQLADGSFCVAYRRDSDDYLVERVWEDTAWGAESVVNAASSYYPSYIQLKSGELRVCYRRGSDDYLVERIWSGAAWGAESVINAAATYYPDYIQLTNDELRVAYRRVSDGYLCERIWSGSTWGAESVINAASITYPNYIQFIDATLHIAYRRNSDGYLVERAWSGAVWGAESVINAASSNDPVYLQLVDGTLHIAYIRVSDSYLCERTLQRYARLGAGIIESGGNATTGYYQVFSDGTAECWGWGFITWVSGQQYMVKTVTLPITFDSLEMYITALSAGSKATDPTSIYDVTAYATIIVNAHPLTTATIGVELGSSAAIADTLRRPFTWRVKGKYTPA